MKKNYSLINLVAILIACVPPAILALIWNTIPARVAIHFDEELKPDQMGDRSELWIIASILSVVSLLVYFLLQNIHRFDPKRKNNPSQTFNKLGLGIVIFFNALNLLLIFSSRNNSFTMSRLFFPLIGLLFVFLGNYMPALKPNYFAGIRLPWTLSDDDNWRRTHFLAGKVWFWCGLAFAVITLFLPINFVMPLFIASILIMVLIPGIYSYRIFRAKNRQ
jgi:uncharacterized membrane protein